jgi:hypothetical protein
MKIPCVSMVSTINTCNSRCIITASVVLLVSDAKEILSSSLETCFASPATSLPLFFHFINTIVTMSMANNDSRCLLSTRTTSGSVLCPYRSLPST